MKVVKGIEMTLPGVAELLKKGFDAFEIHPCRTIDEVPIATGISYTMEQCEPQDAEFYSVYIHFVGGGLDCLADCETEDQAEELVAFLTALCQNYKPY